MDAAYPGLWLALKIHAVAVSTIGLFLSTVYMSLQLFDSTIFFSKLVMLERRWDPRSLERLYLF